MVKCKNSSMGCNRWFSSTYGMKVHARFCFFSGEQGKSRLFLEPYASRQHQRCIPMDIEASGRSRDKKGDEDQTNNVELIQMTEYLNDGIHTSCDGPERRDDENANSCVKPPSSENCISSDAQLSLCLLLAQMSRKAGKKQMDRLLQQLSNPKLDMSEFRSRYTNIRDCISVENDNFSRTIGSLGFRKSTISIPGTKICSEVFIRSPVEVLRRQVRGSSSSSTYFNPPKDNGENYKSFSHPLLAQLGKEAFDCIKDEIMGSGNRNITWCTYDNSTEASFIGMMQFYSDKSRASLKESAFQFYPLHITFLNFSDEYRKKCITNGLTFTAFLPIKTYLYTGDEYVEYSAKREEKIELLHEAIDTVITELREVATQGFTCEDKDGNKRRCHVCIACYCCDIPESKDLTSIRNGNRGIRNCHRCMTNTSDFNKYSNNRYRRGKDTRKTIEDAIELRRNGQKKKADKILDEHSLTIQVPCLENFPFVGIHPVLDFHQLFSFESLHNFHLGISKEIKKCLAERLRCDELKTSAIPMKNGSSRVTSFRMARMSILNGMNNMLLHIQSFSPAKGLRICFGTGGRQSSSGLYTEEGNLVGMLEGRDHRAVDMVLPFLAMFVDRCCDEDTTAPTTNVCTRYVDMMLAALSYSNFNNWDEEKVVMLEHDVEQFKVAAVDLYKNVQPSQFCLEKFHLLDHLGDDIRRLGGLRYSDASLYEYAHTLFKSAYRSGSKRKSTAMDESVLIFMKEMINREEELSESTKPTKPQELNAQIDSAYISAIENDSASISRRGDLFKLKDLGETLRYMSEATRAKDENRSFDEKRWMNLVAKSPEVIRSIISDVDIEACHELSTELWQYLQLHYGKDRNSDPFIVRIKSGYVCGWKTPTLSAYNERSRNVKVERHDVRRCQRVISGRDFCNSKTLQQDCVMIEAATSNRSKKVTIWFGKVLSLFRVANEVHSPSTASKKSEQELAFVQYFDVAPMVDEIDRKLNCVRLVWARKLNDGKGKPLSSWNSCGRKWYGVIDVACIRGVVHIVRGDYGIKGRGIIIDMNEIPWNHQHFYVNRFYHDVERKYFLVDQT